MGQARDGGGDIFTPPYLWECKRRRKFGGYVYMKQAVISADEKGAIPIVAIRADGEESLVIMRMKDALPLLQGEIIGSLHGDSETDRD